MSGKFNRDHNDANMRTYHLVGCRTGHTIRVLMPCAFPKSGGPLDVGEGNDSSRMYLSVQNLQVISFPKVVTVATRHYPPRDGILDHFLLHIQNAEQRKNGF